MERIVTYFATQQTRRFERRGGPSRFDRLVARVPALVPSLFLAVVVLMWVASPNPLLIVIAVVALLVLTPQAFGTRLAVAEWDDHHGMT